MPFLGIGFHVLIALYFAVHAIRTGQNLFWLMILFAFPLLGSIVYLFAIYLPELRDASPGKPALLEQRIGYMGVRRRILIVDNEKIDRELLVSVLAPLGFELFQAESGAECLAALPHVRPHLLFMDLAMPGMNGWKPCAASASNSLPMRALPLSRPTPSSAARITKWAFRPRISSSSRFWWKNCSTGLAARWRWNG